VGWLRGFSKGPRERKSSSGADGQGSLGYKEHSKGASGKKSRRKGLKVGRVVLAIKWKGITMKEGHGKRRKNRRGRNDRGRGSAKAQRLIQVWNPWEGRGVVDKQKKNEQQRRRVETFSEKRFRGEPGTGVSSQGMTRSSFVGPSVYGE